MRPQSAAPKPEPKLKRDLGLFEATVYAVGIILGAGIYALIGEAAGIAGNALWLSFVFAAVIASFTAFSYAELASLFPKSAAEFVYVRNATHSELTAFMIGYLSIFTMMVAAAAVSLGFAGYFTELFGTPLILTALAMVAAFSAINFIGIKESARLNILFTVIEAGGLIAIILLGLRFLGSVDYFAVPAMEAAAAAGTAAAGATANAAAGAAGAAAAATPFGFLAPILAGTALVFFAYIGFEDTANIAEETKDPRKTVPCALLIALVFTTVIYILVSLVAVSAVPYTELAASKAPLALVAEQSMPGSGAWMAIVALFATANTVLILLIVASRVLYGIASEGSLPRIFSVVHPKTKTPYFAIILTALIACAFILTGSIKTVALLTDFGVFIIFFAVNASLVLLRFTMPEAERRFRAPLNIGRVSIPGVLGACFCLFMLLHFLEPVAIAGIEMPLALFGLAVTALSVPLYFAVKKLC